MTSPTRLPRRDLVILPLVSVLTILVLIGGSEIFSRHYFAAQEDHGCRVSDPVLGYRDKPGCSEVLKAFEAGPVVNSYNECGYRTPQSCGPKPPGTLRIALIGSSVGQGHFVSYEASLGAHIAETLTAQCHRPVEVQNLAATEYYLGQVEARTAEALQLKPDLLLWVLTPYDIHAAGTDPPTLEHGPQLQLPLLTRLHILLDESRTFAVMQHFYYEKDSNFVPLFMLNADKAGYLHRDMAPEWHQRLAILNDVVGTIAKQADAAGVPFVTAYVPARPQAVLAHMPPQEGIDPYAIDHEVEKIIESHGASFVDTMPDLEKAAPDPGTLYLPFDGHLNGQGHPLVGNSIAYHLLQSRLGVFANCSPMASMAAANTD
jgi:hypothetical protein